MRMMFCFVEGLSHFEPMMPVARAAQTAGHAVTVACSPWRVAAVEAAGFEAFAIGPSTPPEPPTRKPLLEVDMERERQTLRDLFADRGARRRATGVRTRATEWRPDVIVADEADFGSVIAAEAIGVPYATVLVTASGSFIRGDVVADTLDRVRGEHGLPPDPDFAAPSRYLVLSPFPARLRDPTVGLPATAHRFRTVDVRAPIGPPPPWTQHQSGAPRVYVTLGTQFNVESGDLFARVVEGLSSVAANVLVTVGSQIDPAELGPLPPHIHVERYIPQSEILPYCDAVVFHGGSGTLMGVLAHGLPMVILAMGADQPPNAERCEALGVALALDPVRATPAEVADRVATVLDDPSHRQAAQCLQGEIAALPDPETAVALLERLAAGRRPLPAAGAPG